ncbi:MAG: CehA/McbA family metallohydrolase [Phycisphaerales bacterium]|nr:MAG: CehA/McbA family metallohydrolase [Phycisphaerales bacterium]
MKTGRIEHRWRLAVWLIALVMPLEATGAQRKAPPKAEVVRPKAGQVLRGIVDVQVKLPAGLSPPTYAGLGGPPWVKLEQVDDSNEWTGRINSRMVPNGGQKLTVKTTNKRSDVAVGAMVENPLRIYFADLHSHTGYSDGTLLPVVAHDYARRVAKLDVFVLTDHLEYVDDTEWLDMREAAWDASEDGKFVSIPGLEWTKKIGHINILDPKTNSWPFDLAGFYKAAAEARVICKFNHPGNGEKAFRGLEYSEIGDKALQLMEVRRPEEEKAYIRALKLGWHIAPDGSDDTHSPNWGIRFAWSGILAPGLSKRNILDALKNRHCYSTLDRNCALRFKVNDATMGDIITEAVGNVRVMVAVKDPDACDLIGKIELFEDGAVVQTDEPNSHSRRWRTTFKPEPGEHYYFVKITQKDENLMWSAPVWVTVD